MPPSLRLALHLTATYLATCSVARAKLGDANDPDGLCPAGSTGYKGAPDCSGYYYCADGYLMGGVIPCRPNMRYDEGTGLCLPYHSVSCPGFDSGTDMPDDRDQNANPQRFFCGSSSFNAESLCEPCPGGSRMECRDPLHNCFAQIAKCADDANESADSNASSSSGGGGGGGGGVVPTNPPPPTNNPIPSPTKIPTHSPTRGPTNLPTTFPTRGPTNKPTSYPTNRQTNNPRSEGQVDDEADTAQTIEQAPPAHQNPDGNAFFCGDTLDEILGKCFLSKPCPGGFSAGVCESTEGCFEADPCLDEYNRLASTSVTPSPTKFPTPFPTNYPSQKQTPPAAATNQGQPNNPTPPEKSPSTSPVTDTPVITLAPIIDTSGSNFCGVDWASHSSNCENAVACPTGDECPTGQTCFSASPCAGSTAASGGPATTSNTGAFCGKSWNSLMAICGTATRCPIGDECTEGEFCYRDFTCNPSPAAESPDQNDNSNVGTTDESSGQHSAGSDQSDEGAAVPPLSNVSGRYCARSKRELLQLTSCAGALPCPTGDGCPTGQFCFGDIECGSEETNVPSGVVPEQAQSEPCNLCGAAGQTDWSKTVVYGGTDIACDDFSTIFASNKVMEGTDNCLSVRSAHFDSCCSAPPDKETEIDTTISHAANPSNIGGQAPAPTPPLNSVTTGMPTTFLLTWYTGNEYKISKRSSAESLTQNRAAFVVASFAFWLVAV